MWYMDCEIGKVPRGWKEEPEAGYIQVSDDVRALHEAHAEYIWDGITLIAPPVYVPAPLTLEQIKAQLTLAVQNHLDNKARERGYDSIFTACTYEGDPNPTWSAEGTAYKAWRSQVWQYCLQVLTYVQNGLRPVPTEAGLIAELPIFGGV